MVESRRDRGENKREFFIFEILFGSSYTSTSRDGEWLENAFIGGESSSHSFSK
jgi:hypothetical protein